MNIDVRVKLIRETSKLPEYATDGAADCDLVADITENVVLEPGKRKLIPTGIAIELPSNDVVALVYARSGLATKKGVHLANCVGVIDSDYRGEIGVCLTNEGDDVFLIEPGMRIAQLCFTPVYQAKLKAVDNLEDTDRGAGGFGSTGTK